MGLALGFATGAALAMLGGPWWVPPLVVLGLAGAPILVSSGPGSRGVLGAAAVAAGALAGAATGADGVRCPPPDPGSLTVLEGHLLASPRHGSAPLRRADGCGTVTVVMDAPDVPAGRGIEVRGRWREGTRSFWFAGTEWEPSPRARDASVRWAVVRWRDGLVDRITRLYGEQAPMVTALTLARREGLDPDLRQTFARTGLAHLLAISGFHVGVIAGLCHALLSLVGLPARRARPAAVGAAWSYVGLIGFPDAACRAALILAFVAASRSRGRPPARWGALASALLLLLILDPARIGSVGFQLSFAGAAGLVGWSGAFRAWMRGVAPRRVPDGLLSALAAGGAATLATLPVVAWHFEQISLVGIPATLVAGPLVAVALPGAIASVVLDFAAPGAAAFLAGGVGWLLLAMERGAVAAGSCSWAALWTTKVSVIAAGLGTLVAVSAARRPWIGGRARRWLMVTYTASAMVAWPLALSHQGRGRAELLMIDVGQGDAVALRGPDGTWMLVDAGPPAGVGRDHGGHPVVRALRARGVRRLEALVLTHADLDHVGGAEAVLQSFQVGVVLDPALAAGKEAFVAALQAARARGVPWRAARAGMELSLGDLTVDVLSPGDSLLSTDPEANEASVVLLARLGRFEALLTGDAYKPLERRLASALAPGIEVLKVGHHGSDTSTDPELVDRIAPALALISAGRGNRYGHPTPQVLARLESRGIPVWRTDQDGTVRVVGRADGRFVVRSGRP